MTGPTEDERKIREFIEGKGVTRCRPVPAGPSGPVAMGRSDDRHFNPFAGSRGVDSPEGRLAQAVILRAIQDLAGVFHVGKPGEKEAVRQQACRWIFGREPDFRDWCLMAGYAPSYVREHARSIADGKLPGEWRAAPGRGKLYHERKARRSRRQSGG